jgi:epoxyqueuosine reductase
MKSDEGTVDVRPWIENLIREFLKSSENSLRNEACDRAWDDPLIGFARGDDPLFRFLKEDIGPFHWTPLEIFRLTFPVMPEREDRLSVISWVLPQTHKTKAQNRRETRYPSEAWARSRTYGEEINVRLALHLVKNLNTRGIKAVAPGQSPHWQWQTSEKYSLASNWSERHAAYIAGLGTFGLSDGLITEKGKAIRCGSVIADTVISPTVRNYDHHQAYCLFHTTGECGKCIDRCPVGSITKDGRDKARCKKYLFNVTTRYVETSYGFSSYGCGLCQTGVPCESGIPAPGTADRSR